MTGIRSPQASGFCREIDLERARRSRFGGVGGEGAGLKRRLYGQEGFC
jgi:hypothetical protein